MNNPSSKVDTVLAVLIWFALVSAAIILRPLLPIDETRYITVAWEMFQSGDYWVPTKNGELYSHKPPFFFWLMNLGWGVFGVSETWARLVAPLFGLASIFVTVRLAGALWPDEQDEIREGRAWMAALMMLTGIYWTFFSTMTMFDMMVTLAAVIAILGYVLAWRGFVSGTGFWKGLFIAGIGIGIGGLAKGPAILVHTLPLALFAPLWGPALATKSDAQGWGKWYVGVLVSILVGAGITLAWAVPAAIIGGEEYRNAIFIKQSADRMVKSFAHRRPVYWFLWVVPVMLLPWTLWPRLWKNVGFVNSRREKSGLRGAWADGGVRVLLIWSAASFVIFSAISGKQPHYLLPIFPALALFAGYLLSLDKGTDLPKPRHRLPVIFLGGFALILMTALLARELIEPMLKKPLPDWVDLAQPLWLLPVVLLAAGLLVVKAQTPRTEVRMIAALAGTFMVLLHFAAAPALDKSFNLTPAAERIKAWQDENRPVLYVGKYHGEFQFLGRLTKPLDNIEDMQDVYKWAAKNPDGIVLATRSPRELSKYPDPVTTLPKRAKVLVVWNAKDFVRP